MGDISELKKVRLEKEEKLKELGIENLIETKRGQGYKIWNLPNI